ncbi:MAG: hypothetical protein ABI992_04390 [Chthoniobacterales bacterium]
MVRFFVLLAACALTACGARKDKTDRATVDEKPQTPATAAEAARVIDFSTVPLLEGATPPWPRGVASLDYKAKANPKTAFEFHRKQLLASGWKELPNTSITEQSASATFARNHFLLSLSVFPSGQGEILVRLQNLGNIRPGNLPVPPGVKPVYVGDASAMYVTEAAVPATAAACQQLLVTQGWTPYGSAGDSVNYKKNAIRISATVSAAPAQGGKTMIAYSTEQLSVDIPAPTGAEDLRYTDQTQELSFETAAKQDAVVAFYRQALTPAKWEATLDHPIEIDDKNEVIFRNPSKDMLTLAMPARGPEGKTRVSVRYQSAREIAELDKKLKEEAPALRAAAEAKEKEESARFIAAHTLPKLAVALPADAAGVAISPGEIKFTVAHGKAKATVQVFQKQFQADGWKEDLSTLDPLAGAISVSKGNQRIAIDYTDTGVTPTEITVSAIGAELERK